MLAVAMLLIMRNVLTQETAEDYYYSLLVTAHTC